MLSSLTFTESLVAIVCDCGLKNLRRDRKQKVAQFAWMSLAPADSIFLDAERISSRQILSTTIVIYCQMQSNCTHECLYYHHICVTRCYLHPLNLAKVHHQGASFFFIFCVQLSSSSSLAKQTLIGHVPYKMPAATFVTFAVAISGALSLHLPFHSVLP